MANLLDFYFEQLVTEGDLDTMQGNLESSDKLRMTDLLYIGIAQGYDVEEHSPTPDLTVDIAGPGFAYDQEGNRVNMPTSQTLDVSVDSNSNPTAVTTPGNEKWVSVFVQFTRNQSDLRYDGNGVPVYFRNDESFQFVVTQGAEATIGSATRPPLESDALLIADIRLINGQTQILDADIESSDVVTKPNSRFQFVFNLTTSSPEIIRVGPLPDALQDMLDVINGVLTGGSSSIGYDPASVPSTWDNLEVATNVQDAIDAIYTDLGDTALSYPGSRQIGVNDSLWYWANGNQLGGGGLTHLQETITWILDDLYDQTGTDDGAHRIGFDGSARLSGSAVDISATQTTIRKALEKLDDSKGSLGNSNAWTAANTWTGASEFSGTGAFNILGNKEVNIRNGNDLGGFGADWFNRVRTETFATSSTGAQVVATLQPMNDGDAYLIEVVAFSVEDGDMTDTSVFFANFLASKNGASIAIEYMTDNGSDDQYGIAGADSLNQVFSITTAVTAVRLTFNPSNATDKTVYCAWRSLGGPTSQP